MCSECSICLEHIDDKDKLILDCKHNYHVDCIKNLFKHELNNGTKNIVSCPCCRTDINNTSNEDINNMINELKEKIILLPSPNSLLNHIVRLNNLFDRYINTETSLINYRNRRIYEHTYQMTSYTTHTYYTTNNQDNTNNIMRSHTYISNITYSMPIEYIYRIQSQPIYNNIPENRNNIHDKKRIKKLNIIYYNKLNKNNIKNRNRTIKQNYKKQNYKKHFYNKNIKNKNYNYLR